MFNNTPFTMPVTPAGYTTGGTGMFGGDGLWGLIIILALLGWGGNGFGFGGGARNAEPYATQADVRAAVDQQTLISKLDQQTYGLADSTYALNNTITNGFHGVDNAICTLGYNVQSGFNGLSHQISDCCCATQRAIDGINYNMATQACEIKQSIADNTKSIIDFLVSDKLATLQAENQSLRLQASQAAQNAYLINELKPCPSPAYVVPNPNCGCGYGYGNVVVGA
jgi:hypothetical protein